MKLKTESEYARFRALISYLIETKAGGKQTKLAEMIGGVNCSTISQWVNPRKRQSPRDHLDELLTFLGWSYTELKGYLQGTLDKKTADNLPVELYKHLYLQSLEIVEERKAS